jgi:beta-lactamase class A
MAATDDVRQILEGRPGTFGVFARNLTTGETVDVDSSRRMQTASAAKQFILVTYAEQVAAGTLDPATRVALTDDDRTLGSGVLRYLAQGLAPTLDDLACLMVIVSDNVATNVVLRSVGGPDTVNRCMDAFDLPDARLHGPSGSASFGATPFGTATPRALADAFALVAESAHRLSDGAAERCRRLLFRQQFVDGLPRRLPSIHQAIDFGFEMPLTVYNKPGGEPTVCTDAGLFVAKDTEWVAAVMAEDLPLSKMGPDDVGPLTCADVGEVLWRAWGPPEALTW